jgi:putative tryptophan/tyrosine transport system substrate-binding protein
MAAMMLRLTAVMVGLLLLGIPTFAHAQPVHRIWRIGYLTPAEIQRATFSEALRALGYVEDQTITFEVRTAHDDLRRLPELAADLVRAKVDIIVAVSPPAIVAARQATTTIPVVMRFWGGAGLLESGVVASFTRPGGNVTGVYMFAAELDAKRLELLLEAVPQARTVGVLNPGRGWSLSHLRHVAEVRKVHLRISDEPGSSGYGPVFAALSKAKVDAVLVPSFPRFYREHRSIIAAAARGRIPAIYEWGEIARAGGLMGYGPLREEIERRAAIYVDKILKGASPADLPVEQPTKFELVVNMKTAKALGLTISPSVLARADQVIE